MGKLAIVGAGGHGRETLDVIRAINDHIGDEPLFDVVGFFDDNVEACERVARMGSTIVGTVAELLQHDTRIPWVCAIGSSRIRKELDERISLRHPPCPPIVHPNAIMGTDIDIGDAVIVASGCHITTNVSVGKHTHFNVGSVAQHDSQIGEFVTISPGVYINGDVVIGNDVFIGAGAIITRGVTVGAGASVGAGSVVLSDVLPGHKVYGVPARSIGITVEA